MVSKHSKLSGAVSSHSQIGTHGTSTIQVALSTRLQAPTVDSLDPAAKPEIAAITAWEFPKKGVILGSL